MGDFIKSISVQEIANIMNFHEVLCLSNDKSLNDWKMELDDQPILCYIYRNFRPRRHLEFGIWQGSGVVYCLEESNATVWTINKPFGEISDDKIVYSLYPEDVESARRWAEKVGFEIKNSYQTDRIGFIGRFYLEKNLGQRVCQIYCDSKEWDTSNYPSGFFDSVFIDGGHDKETVVNDTLKSIPLARNGGLLIWHDYCPDCYYSNHKHVKDVIDAIESIENRLSYHFKNLFYIFPSWILLGIKNG